MKNFDKKKLDQFLKDLRTFKLNAGIDVCIKFETEGNYKGLTNIKESKNKYSNFEIYKPSSCQINEEYIIVLDFIDTDEFEYWTEIFVKAVNALDNIQNEIDHFKNIPNDFKYLQRNL